MDKKSKLDTFLGDIADTAEKVGTKVKGTVQQTVANLEKRAETEGTLTHKAVEAGKKAADYIEKTADSLSARVEEYHNQIMAKGGYKKVFIDIPVKSVTKAYDKAEESLFTDGKFDKEKAKKLYDQGVDIVQEFGADVAQCLKDYANDQATDFRDKFPGKKEREEKYAGIGTKLPYALTRDKHEAVVAFRTWAEKAIHPLYKNRQALINDINATAATSKMDLLMYYTKQTDPEGVMTQGVEKYLKGYRKKA